MAAEKEKPESTDKAETPSPGVETATPPPDKMAGPQPVARGAQTLTNPASGGAAGRARMVGNMQQNVGNARVGRMLGGGVQRKVEVSSPEDAEEKEADQTAEKVMRMTDEDAGAAASSAPTPATPGSGGGGGGQPLSKADRDFMEPRFGRSFDDVRLHTDREAQDQATGIGAKAFTKGSDISFGPGAGPGDKKLLAHELTHVAQQGNGNGSDKTMRAPGPLSAAEEASAVNFMRAHYDERSIRIIQSMTGTTVDGKFGEFSAQAVAVWQGAHGLGTIDGKVGTNTVNEMVVDRALNGAPEDAIQLCVDFRNLDVKSDTLTVHFVPEGPIDFLQNLFTGAPSSSVVFGPGNLRVIRVGPRAFFSEPTLFAAINAQLTAPAPAVAPVGPRPTLLTPAQERSAISFNKSRFTDRRSVLAIQGHVGANPDATFGPDTVERIADAQRLAGFTVIDGKVGLETLELFVTDLTTLDQQDAAIRLIVDFFNFRHNGNLLDVHFDPNEPDEASTIAAASVPALVAIGPRGMNQPFAGVVHTIAHEFEHVRRFKQGIGDVDTQEFLGESVEILSVGMPEEEIENVASGAAFVSFMNDARRALHHWNLMTLPDRRQFRARFIAVRERVRTRLGGATAAQQALHAPILADYNAVVLP